MKILFSHPVSKINIYWAASFFQALIICVNKIGLDSAFTGRGLVGDTGIEKIITWMHSITDYKLWLFLQRKFVLPHCVSGGEERSARFPVLWLAKGCLSRWQVLVEEMRLWEMYGAFMKVFLIGHTKKF